ncbi:MAG: FAD-dependent oxidoreductase, partial [Planctomycetota bacterium]
VFFGQAKFATDSHVVIRSDNGEETELQYRKAVITTGARAAAPPIAGLSEVPYLTNESLFSLTTLPKTMGVIGSGPIGCEMAQAFARFGTRVFLFETQDRILTREDVDAAEVVKKSLIHDGVQLVLNANDMEVSQSDCEKIEVRVKQQGASEKFEVEKLLLAVGRAPNVENLGLEEVGVEYGRHGVQVNDFLQTTNRKIFAAGDVCSKYQFTHAADFMARIVIQNSLFAIGPLGRKKASDLLIPWATYSQPEVAHVGLYERDAKELGIEIDTYIQSFEDIDRAILEGNNEGFVKVHTRKGTDKIIGATIVSENAGDLISEITLAMKHGIGLSQISSTIHPYPTHAEAIRKIGDQFNKTKLTSFNRKILGFLRRLNVGN